MVSINVITFVGESQHPPHSSEAKEDVEIQNEGEHNYIKSGFKVGHRASCACVTNTWRPGSNKDHALAFEM